MELRSPRAGVLARISRVMKQKFELQLRRDVQGKKSLYSDKLELNSNLDRVWTAGRVDTFGMTFY